MAGNAENIIPSLSEILSSSPSRDSPLATALSVLFEPSPILFSELVPLLAAAFAKPGISVTTYSALVDISIAAISGWDDPLKAQFVAGHPRIGESHNLSKLSANEQGAAAATSSSVKSTPPEVLERLTHLNACYEQAYPGIRYITFVNGRSRAEVAEEMENVLRIEHSLSADEPKLATFPEMDRQSWKAELERAVKDVGLIAQSRLTNLGLA